MNDLLFSLLFRIGKEYTYNEYVNCLIDRWLWRRILHPFLSSYKMPNGESNDDIVRCFNEPPFKCGLLGRLVSFADYQICQEDVMAALYVSSQRDYVRKNHKLFEELSYNTIMHLRDNVKQSWLLESLLHFYDVSSKDFSVNSNEDGLSRLYRDPSYCYERYFSIFNVKYGETIRVYFPSKDGKLDYSDENSRVRIKIDKNRIVPNGFFLVGLDYALEEGNELAWVKCVRSKAGKNTFITNIVDDNESMGEVIWRL